jgi:hypothetical protein
VELRVTDEKAFGVVNPAAGAEINIHPAAKLLLQLDPRVAPVDFIFWQILQGVARTQAMLDDLAAVLVTLPGATAIDLLAAPPDGPLARIHAAVTARQAANAAREGGKHGTPNA